MRKTLFVFVAAAAALTATLASAQSVPLPPTPDVYSRAGSPTAQVVVEEHMDLLCPDCADASAVVAQLTQHYSASQVTVVKHLFPLPYHTWAFLAANIGTVIRSLAVKPDAAADAWAAYLFSGAQANFWNDATAGNSSAVVQNMMVAAAAQVTGLPIASIQTGLQNPNLNMATRISWKFGCSRGVTGTPSFFVNGLAVGADSTWTLQNWTALLDPLLAAGATKQRASVKLSQLSGFTTFKASAEGTS